MMKFGLHSAILPGMTFEEFIDYAAQVGFECAEICCWPVGKAIRRYAGITHIDINNSDNDKLLYYKKYAEDKGVDIAILGYYPNPLDPEQQEVAVGHINKLIDAAATMNVNKISTFIGRDKTKCVE
ncbi:MAG: sugar phosphate isomerase/epimerase, partial [Lachnospiraceae bacterium]|nr:sugar phosphate isomerase/epimerase [Lachnospiraceae bacterium]